MSESGLTEREKALLVERDAQVCEHVQRQPYPAFQMCLVSIPPGLVCPRDFYHPETKTCLSWQRVRGDNWRALAERLGEAFELQEKRHPGWHDYFSCACGHEAERVVANLKAAKEADRE